MSNKLGGIKESNLAHAVGEGQRGMLNYVGQYIGWVNPILIPISLVRAAYKTIRKRNHIAAILRTETDPAKQARMKQILVTLSSNQVKILKKLELKDREISARKK